jgi:hypothetical protein
MQVERIGGGLVLVESRAASAARWRWRGERIEVESPSGNVYAVSPADVPIDVAIGLLALRDAERYHACGAAEPPSGFAFRAWLETSRDPLLAGPNEAEAKTPSWIVYRFMFLAASATARLSGTSEGGSEAHARQDPRVHRSPRNVT